jgi:hypothetical protein
MRKALLAPALLALLLPVGCDSKVKEGVPEKIDMSKDYSPAAKPIGINPADSKKMDDANKKGPAGMPGAPGGN